MTSKQWQLDKQAALRYETILVRKILGPFARALVDWAVLPEGGTVVDIGCGTGAAARHAALRIGQSGRVIGIDVNPGMLAVARSLPNGQGAALEWREESAAALSLADGVVDGVLCAQTLQFLTQKDEALAEMWRVLKDNRAAYISLWCPLEENPYFEALVASISHHIGPDTAAGLGAAFNLTGLEAIKQLVRAGGFGPAAVDTAELVLELPPVAQFVPEHIRATPMGPGYAAASADVQRAVVDEMGERLADYVWDEGMRVPFRSHLVRASR